MEITIKNIQNGIITFIANGEVVVGHTLNAPIGGVDGYRALAYARHQILDIKREVSDEYITGEGGDIITSYPKIEDTMDVIVSNCTIPEWD